MTYKLVAKNLVSDSSGELIDRYMSICVNFP